MQETRSLSADSFQEYSRIEKVCLLKISANEAFPGVSL
jgi:hypothetical protein